MPCSSGELWGHHFMPSKIELDILLPTGVVIPLQCARDQTLRDIKTKVWEEGPKYPYFSLVQLPTSYVFTSVTQDAKKEEFHDESRRLCDLHLFIPFLKLVEPNASTKQENIINSQLTAALGIKVGKLDELENSEVVEFRREVVSLCRDLVNEREESLESHAYYAYSAQLARTPKPPPTLFPNGAVTVSVFLNPSLSIMVRVQMEANAETIVRETRLSLSKKGIGVGEGEYVLKICGREEYLQGSHHISQYKHIRDCYRKHKDPPLLELVDKKILYSKLPNEPFHTPTYLRRAYKVSECEGSTNSGSSLHLWRITNQFRVQILWALYINATDNVCVKAGIFHGDEQLCTLRQTAQLPFAKISEKSFIPKWNEYLTFDIAVSDIPRSARLCISLCSVTKNKKKQEEYSMLAWGNVNLFDFRGRLITGKLRLDLWPSPHIIDSISLMHPLGITGSRLEKEGSALELEFDRYSVPVYFPHMSEIYELVQFINKDEPGNSDPQRDINHIRSLVSRDQLCEVSEQDKHLVWQYREHCRDHIPDSLPRLVASVKWSSREQTATFYEILKDWRPIPMETAVILLDSKNADIYVREFAIKNLECLPDCDILDLLLQLVQALKYESYLNSHISRFLLRRALLNRLIGHFFFWHLRSEISGKSWLDLRFGIYLEAYCRGLCGHLKELNKQVEALEKLTMLTETLKEKKDESPGARLKFLSEQIKQADFLEVLENMSSPVNPCIQLGALKVDSCRIMDSAKRPLWLVWHTNDKYHSHSGMISETAAIFKNGDDLRQDMLTLQVVRMMDELWRRDGLDLKMLSYTCLATGKQVGLIQVVRNAQTVYTIQRKAGALSAIQVNSKKLHAWLKGKNNESEEKYSRAIDTFTKSCAGYCVATFVLGIGDRNPDNIMVAEDGHIFHIDFGHFLGHFKKKFGINRERVPFVLTDDFLYVISRGTECPKKSTQFQEFQKLCIEAYLILRNHANLLLSLFTLMLPTGIAELQSNDVDYLRNTLAVDKDDQAALNYFQTAFSDAYGESWITKLDWFFHSLNHIKDANQN